MALIYLYGLFCLIVFLVRVIRRYWANISDWMVWAGRIALCLAGLFALVRFIRWAWRPSNGMIESAGIIYGITVLAFIVMLIAKPATVGLSV